MVRSRLVLLVTIAALLAPWVAPCLASAPDGHAAMPCCRTGHGQDGGPVARPCCGPVNREPATAPSAPSSLPHLAQVPAVVQPGVSLATPRRLDTIDAALPPIAARLRSVVLLI